MGGPFVSCPADVRVVLLRRHLLDHQSGVRGPVYGGPRLVHGRLRLLPERLFPAVHLRRTDHLRHAAGPLGGEADGLDIRGADGRRGGADNIRHIGELRRQPVVRVAVGGVCQAVAVAGVCRVRDVRTRQRDSRCDGQPGHSQMVQGPGDSPGHGTAARPGPSGYCRGTDSGAADRGTGGVYSVLGDFEAGCGRDGAAARGAGAVGAVRGDGLWGGQAGFCWRCCRWFCHWSCRRFCCRSCC